MDKAKKNGRMHSLKPTAKRAVKQLKSNFLPDFMPQTKNDMSTRRDEISGPFRKGHFSVVLENGEPKKFLVALRYLTYPPFIKLLDAAEKEYGFNQKGALVIPYEASELERILS